MILSEYTYIGTIIDNIEFLSDDTNKNLITEYIEYNFSEKTMIPKIEKSNTEETAKEIGNFINLIFADKWKAIKDSLAYDISGIEHTDTETTTEHNNIYGFNSSSGVNDYEKTTTKENIIQDDNPYEKMTDSIDFKTHFSYYYIVIKDIVFTITTEIFD